MTRRRFIGGAVATGFGFSTVLGACWDGDDDDGGDGSPDTTTSTEPPDLLDPIDHGEPVGEFPFGLGVASGDPDHSSVLLWTWLAGEATRELLVEVALDETFESIVARASLTAEPAVGMSARIIVDGLNPDAVYWYRFVADGHITAPARTRTAPAPGQMPSEPVRVAQLSCMRKSAGYWSALADVADTAPDVVVHCGDYIYEDETGTIRPEQVTRPVTLDDHRAVWRRYKVEPELQAAHAAAPWLAVWDDHEVENNYQGTDPGDPPEGEAFLAQRSAAYRAWWEFTPTRVPQPPDNAVNLRIYRHVDWGALTRFVLLDTRQYRDDQPCTEGLIGGDLGPRCEETATVTMLGAHQETWFDDTATTHDAVWTTVVQQVVLHQWRFAGGNAIWNLDQWDGYTGARDRLMGTLAQAPNPVVLSGDVHSSWASDLLADFDDRDSDAVGVEFVAPGVSSSIPSSLRNVGPLIELSSPHIAWSQTTKRGWVLHTVGADEWRTEYRLVDDPTRADSAVPTAKRFSVRAGNRSIA